MTDVTVEGGLDEPAELEPEQGSLALASPEDTHGRADWEGAAAAVLRKARRLTDEDDDSLVWEKLTRPTLDGIGVTPLGTPDLLDGLQTSGRPTRSGDWDIRAHLGVVDAKSAHEEAMTDLENGVTSLWLRLEPDADLDTLLDGVFLDLAPVVLDAPDRPDGRGHGAPHPGRGHRAPPGHQPRHPRREGDRRGRGAGLRQRRARVRRRRDRRSTTGAPPTSRSSRTP